MHLPDGILSGHVELAGAVVAAGGLALAGRAAMGADRDRAELPVTAGRIAGVGALVFAAQMANVPVAAGASAHVLGVTLAVALLGPAVGVLTVSAVVALQALAFADGGVTSLGVNLLTLALVPGLVSWLVLRGRRRATLPRLGGAATAAVLASVVAFSGLYAAGSLGGDPALAVAGSMLAVHVPMVLLEALVTVGAIAALRRTDVRAVHLGAAAFVVAVFAAPFASTAPDGLERVAHDRGFLGLAGDHPLAWSPVADYELSGAPPFLAVSLAGLAGVALIGLLLSGGSRLALARRRT